MSSLEHFIWYTLGYATMPLIFIGGFAVTAVIGCFCLERLNRSRPNG